MKVAEERRKQLRRERKREKEEDFQSFAPHEKVVLRRELLPFAFSSCSLEGNLDLLVPVTDVLFSRCVSR